MLTSGRRQDAGVNPRFVTSFRKLMHLNIPHLMLFSDTDPRWFAFNDSILGRKLAGPLDSQTYSVRVITEADHNLFLQEHRDTAVRWIVEWMHHNAGAVTTSAEQPVRGQMPDAIHSAALPNPSA